MSDQEAGGPPQLTLAEVAALVDGRVSGDGELTVRGMAALDEAGEEQLALLSNRRYLGRVASSAARALLVSEALSREVEGVRPLVVVQDPHAALVRLLARLYPTSAASPSIHPTAVIGRGVRLGSEVLIGPYAVLEEGVRVGDRVRIGAHVVVGGGSALGDDTVLHPHVVLYPRVRLGRRVIVHAGARLGSDGFGYVFREGAYQKIPQVGGCVVEDDVEIGANTTIDRGSIGDTLVGRGSKFDNLVHLGHNVRVGPHCAMAAQVAIAGSSRIGEGVVFGGQSGLGGHLEVGAGAQVSAKAGILTNVGEGEAVAGFPARNLKQTMRAWAWMLRLPELARRVKALEDRLGASVPEGPPSDEDA